MIKLETQQVSLKIILIMKNVMIHYLKHVKNQNDVIVIKKVVQHVQKQKNIK